MDNWCYMGYGYERAGKNKSRVIWQKNFNKAEDEAVYSDHLYEWDDRKYDSVCEKIWGNKGQMFHNRKPEEIEQFLSLYFDKGITLTAIVKETNMSNGYPYWIFYYREDKC